MSRLFKSRKVIALSATIALSAVIIIVGTTAVFTKGTQLKEPLRRVEVFYKGTREIINAGLQLNTQPFFLNTEKYLFEAELAKDSNYVVARSAYQQCIDNANRCFPPTSYVLNALYLEKATFEVKAGNLLEGNNDLRKSLVRPNNARQILITKMWLERILIEQNKTSEAIVLGRKNLHMAEELTKEGTCERYLLIQTIAALAHNLDLANKSAEASPLWRQHLDLIKDEYGSNSSAYLQCSKNFAKHELLQ